MDNFGDAVENVKFHIAEAVPSVRGELRFWNGFGMFYSEILDGRTNRGEGFYIGSHPTYDADASSIMVAMDGH